MDAEAQKQLNSPPMRGAKWVQPLVRIDDIWSKIEMYMVLTLLVIAMLFMSFLVMLKALTVHAGSISKYPAFIAGFAGVASLLNWGFSKEKKPIKLILPVVVLLSAVGLYMASSKQQYFNNISLWLADSSVIKLGGAPSNVSARLFTVWVALLGASLATSAGRQINIDVVMRFLGEKSRLVVACIGYALTAATCMVVAWGFCDEIAVSSLNVDKKAPAKEKISAIADGMSRHFFLFRKQVVLDIKSLPHLLKGEKYDGWLSAKDWNEEINEGGWSKVYPPPKGPTQHKPCSSPEVIEAAVTANTWPENWRLTSMCDASGDAQSKRMPILNPPEPDNRNPLETEMNLLFPLGFLMIALRFLMRIPLALGGAVSTDPNAAHGDPTHESPSDPEHTLPEEPKAGKANDVKETTSQNSKPIEADPEPPANKDVLTPKANSEETTVTAQDSNESDGVPTPQRLEAAQRIAAEEEEDATVIGNMAELAKRAEERVAQQAKSKKSPSNKGEL